eukprot:scaffold2774_cov137-Isochrysis_galbana.AAC.8
MVSSFDCPSAKSAERSMVGWVSVSSDNSAVDYVFVVEGMDEVLGGHTFPIGLGGVNTDVRLSVRHLCEDQKEMLGLVELAQALFVPTGLEFASGVLLSGTNHARRNCADAPVFRGYRRPPLGRPDLLQLALLEWAGMGPLLEQSVRQGEELYGWVLRLPRGSLQHSLPVPRAGALAGGQAEA